MISRCLNIIFVPVIKLYGLIKSVDRVAERLKHNIEDVTIRDALRAKILERISQAQAKDRDLMLNREEAAVFLSIKLGTLAMWKSNKRYDLPYLKVGRHIRYRASDLIKFLERNINVLKCK